MRQVPRYAIIGDGSVATHFCHYFKLLDIPFVQWSRNISNNNSLEQTMSSCEIVLILISDSAIDEFILENPCLKNKTLIHFSGSLCSSLAYGAHPLMTFNENLYDLETYKTIPFVLDNDAPKFQDLFPELENQNYSLDKDLKPLYHSMCVMAGNFSCLLWQKIFSEFEKNFNLPKQAAFPYFKQQMQNILQDSDSALTGPLVRNDTSTIDKNINALNSDPYQIVYKAFLSAYQEENHHE